MEIRNITIEGLESPIGIDVKHPVIRWTALSNHSKYQKMFRVAVYTAENGRCVFVSGKQYSNRMQYQLPDEAGLQPKTGYHVSVQLWDENGKESEMHTPAYFETGFMGDGYQGAWIEPDQETAFEEPECRHFGEIFMPQEQTAPELRLKPCQYLRKEFSLKGKKIKRARLYATSHGIYRIFLNGGQIEQSLYAPELTSYQHRLFYQTYDVTGHLKGDRNTWGVILADGWHIGRIGLSGDSCQYADRLAFWGQLDVEYEDGSRQVIATDRSFKSGTGKYVYSDFFIGEMQDGRSEEEHFSENDFDDSAWDSVSETEDTFETLEGQTRKIVKVLERIPACRKIEAPNGDIIFDFGRCIAGVVSMRVSGPAGTKVVLDHCEVLDRDGNFIAHILGRNKNHQDIYILAGKGDEVFTPDFTYHGFRYVRVTGYPGVPQKEDFTAIVIGTDMKSTLQFSTNDERINQLQKNIFNSQRSNMVSVATDCPQREKAAFTGDIQVYGTTGFYNMDWSFFEKDWLKDVRLDQNEKGEVPNFAPYYPKMKRLQERACGNVQHSAGWGDACALLPWDLYWQYGDENVLKENYGMIEKWIAFIQSEAPDGIWRNSEHFGDWLIPSLTGQGMELDESQTDIRYIVATAYYARTLSLAEEIGRILHIEEKKLQQYHALHERVCFAFKENFVKGSRLTADYQGMYVLAIQMKLLDEENEERMLERLLELLQENGYRLDTGFMSVRYLLPLLCEHGYSEIAAKLLFQEESPSWLYQVKMGATSMWEKWDSMLPDGTVQPTSFNHFAFGCVGEFLYKYVAGLKPLKPGFEEIAICPDLGLGFERVEIKYESVRGDIEVSYEKKDGKVSGSIQIPFNTTAYLMSAQNNKNCWQSIEITAFVAHPCYDKSAGKSIKITQKPCTCRWVHV